MTNNQVFKDIYNRVSELKRMVIEDGDEYPDKKSEETFNNFISIFNLTKLPEITIDEYGLYYLRIVKDNKKLVMLFLADGNIQYLIEHFNEHIEQINSPKFIYNIFEKFIIEMI